MRYRVQFRYREDTGEVEVFRVETVDADLRASDHDEAHDRVATELAGIVEPGALIEELLPEPARPAEQVAPAPRAQEDKQESRTASPRTQSA
jgi:FtsH ternary system domain X3